MWGLPFANWSGSSFISTFPSKEVCWDFPGGPVFKTWALNAGGMSSIPSWGTKILHASQKDQKKKKTNPNFSPYRGPLIYCIENSTYIQ